jgi:dTDP-4-amino-4,6-dideoxygalactose transaminase
MEHKNTLRGHNVEFFSAAAGGTCRPTHTCALNSYTVAVVIQLRAAL